MIAREVLRRITPNAPQKLEDQLHPREREATSEDPLLFDIAVWCEGFRKDLAALVRDSEEAGSEEPILSALNRATAVGYGILDWYDPAQSEDRFDSQFPIEQNYRLGISIYLSASIRRGPLPIPTPIWTSLSGRYGNYPIAIYNADFTDTAHPKRGCSAALLRVDGDEMLLTARHVVGKRAEGRRVKLSCPKCPGGCFATVAKKGPGYIDVATLKVELAQCISSSYAPPTSRPVDLPCKGLAVRNHFSSVTGYVQATIKEGLEKPSDVTNPIRPRTFTTSVMSVLGDSGSAVSTDPDHGDPTLVGVHLGITNVEVTPGNFKQRSYALEAQEAIRVFGATLEQEFFK